MCLCLCEQGACTHTSASGALELQLHGASQRLHGEAGVHDLPGERVQWYGSVTGVRFEKMMRNDDERQYELLRVRSSVIREEGE